MQEVVAKKVLVAQVNLMKTPTKERLAEKLAETIYEHVASVLFRARERLRVFADLRIRPIVTIDPGHGHSELQLRRGLPADRTSTRRSSACSSCPAS